MARSFLLMLVLLLSGCGISQQAKLVQQIKHRDACGVVAIEDILIHYDQREPRHRISSEILGNSNWNMYRRLLSIAHFDAYSITFPSELIKALERRGFWVLEIKGSHEELVVLTSVLSLEGETGILLSRDRRQWLNYHYETFPPRSRAGSLYGGHAKYERVFWVRGREADRVILAALIKTPAEVSHESNAAGQGIN